MKGIEPTGEEVSAERFRAGSDGRALSLIVLDDRAARRHGSAVLARKWAETTFLPVLVTVAPDIQAAPWLRAGYGDVLRQPLALDELRVRFGVYLRLGRNPSTGTACSSRRPRSASTGWRRTGRCSWRTRPSGTSSAAVRFRSCRRGRRCRSGRRRRPHRAYRARPRPGRHGLHLRRHLPRRHAPEGEGVRARSSPRGGRGGPRQDEVLRRALSRRRRRPAGGDLLPTARSSSDSSGICAAFACTLTSGRRSMEGVRCVLIIHPPP